MVALAVVAVTTQQALATTVPLLLAPYAAERTELQKASNMRSLTNPMRSYAFKDSNTMNNDSLIQANVLEELKWRPSIDAAHIGVTANEGVVTLTGQVTHYAEKTTAEETAKGVFGVRGVANDIVVEILGSHKRNDTDVAVAALNALTWDYQVPHDQIKVVVKNGWVTLDGTVDWQYQKDAAERAVRHLEGVAAVSNQIALKPTAKWIDVTHKIEDAFRRNADLDSRRIKVHTASGTVTLTGSVASWTERNQAMWAAWSAPGVTSVINDITVAP